MVNNCTRNDSVDSTKTQFVVERMGINAFVFLFLYDESCCGAGFFACLDKFELNF